MPVAHVIDTVQVSAKLAIAVEQLFGFPQVVEQRTDIALNDATPTRHRTHELTDELGDLSVLFLPLLHELPVLLSGVFLARGLRLGQQCFELCLKRLCFLGNCHLRSLLVYQVLQTVLSCSRGLRTVTRWCFMTLGRLIRFRRFIWRQIRAQLSTVWRT